MKNENSTMLPALFKYTGNFHFFPTNSQCAVYSSERSAAGCEVTHPEYKAFRPSSLPILTNACNIPRYLISLKFASFVWPWIWSRVFVKSIGNVP